MNQTFVLHLIVFTCILCIIQSSSISSLIESKGHGVIRHVDGVEFDSISRGTLLQILSAFDENIKSRMGGKKIPLFKAEFANNKHTYPFIYPHFFNKKEIWM
ncbi:uncharacterized protein LOC123692829 [Colias croceus]|uniref:uncharacterized protein LOC123692829 n=1 Tax=Colias crocea TaxID=72248 RepID=UPI001E27D93C|nr:uncharacterized protein LOC123692829 [Colias croceus]